MSAAAPMLSGAGAGTRTHPLWPGAGVCLGMALAAYALRLLLSAGSGASLHVDEAQYWDWSRQLQWGYYSKPPVIAALIALSTQLFGDGETGLRALPMLCYPLTALVLSALAADAARDTGRAAQAAIWAAAIWLASPLAGLLGVVATTDGPLLLCWALALAALWWAVVRRRPLAWALLALALGVGLLSKYSMAALVPGAGLWVLLHGRPRQRLAFVAALLAALLLWSPNLAWNQAAGWPTWRHTADITVAATSAGSGWAGRLAELVEFSLGQTLVFGPGAVWLAWWLRRAGTVQACPLRPLLVWASLPLAAAGLLQAWRGGAQINWIAPVYLAGSLGLAWRLALAAPTWPRRAAALLLVQALGVVVLTAGPGLAQRLGGPWPAQIDPWARMRGWGPALGQLAPVVQAHPGALLVSPSRAVLAHAAYHGRGLGWSRAAWQPGTGPAQHHYALRCRWQPGPGPREVLVISEGPPPALEGGARWNTLATAALRERRGQLQTLWLSQVPPPLGAQADAPSCR